MNEVEFRFWSRVVKSDGCWNWTGSHSGGYPRFVFRGTNWKASRVMWVLVNGEIPPGLFCCHKCDNRGCVKPDHLFIGTAKDNADDMVAKKRHHAQSITHCPQGHPYSGDNLWISNAGGRTCLICAVARTKKSRQNTPGVAERARESNRRYHAENAEKIRVRKREAWRKKKELTTI